MLHAEMPRPFASALLARKGIRFFPLLCRSGDNIWLGLLASYTRAGEQNKNCNVGRFVGRNSKTDISSYFYYLIGGRGGIRTHDTVLPHTRFPSVRLQPLGHPSGAADNAQGDPLMQPLGSPPQLTYGTIKLGISTTNKSR